MQSYFGRKLSAPILAVALLVATLALVAGVRADGKGPKAAASSPQVKIDNFTFDAATITVPVGSEVTWVNRDDIPHTVTSEDGVFRSKALDTDEKFSYKFEKSGTYHYFCSIHPKMTAEVVVK